MLLEAVPSQMLVGPFVPLVEIAHLFNATIYDRGTLNQIKTQIIYVDFAIIA